MFETKAFAKLRENLSDTTVTSLQTLIGNFAETSWLMTISVPRLILNFDVVGEIYDGKVKQRFQQYSTEEKVLTDGKAKGTVLYVVWPSVESEDGSSAYKKGEAITPM